MTNFRILTPASEPMTKAGVGCAYGMDAAARVWMTVGAPR
jgi:hypothetical protein